MKTPLTILAIIIAIVAVMYGIYVSSVPEGMRQVVEDTRDPLTPLNPVDFGLPETAKEHLDKRTEHTATFEIEPGKFAQVSL